MKSSCANNTGAMYEPFIIFAAACVVMKHAREMRVRGSVYVYEKSNGPKKRDQLHLSASKRHGPNSALAAAKSTTHRAVIKNEAGGAIMTLPVDTASVWV